MAFPPLEVRVPRPDEDVVLLTAAAKRLNVDRQNLDQAVRARRVRGFKSSEDGRIYVDAAQIDRRARLGRDRVKELETKVSGLQAELEQLRTKLRAAGAEEVRVEESSEAPPGPDRDYIITLLLGAADEEASARKAAGKADQLLDEHRTAVRQARDHQLAAIALYREALTQYSLPGTLDGL